VKHCIYWFRKKRWASGTRIGAVAGAFVKDYAKNMIDSKTIVIILSDGWDTGDLDSLKKSMEYLHNKSKKLIWLNPLAGYPAFSARRGGYEDGNGLYRRVCACSQCRKS
jgi:uncharacterized protein with von Willebrand factor type A (vWA) domain